MKRGGQIGNKNATKENRLVGDMLRRIAKQNPEKLRKACEKVLDKAIEGDVSAFKEFADRLDGKSVQPVSGTGEDGAFIFQWQK